MYTNLGTRGFCGVGDSQVGGVSDKKTKYVCDTAKPRQDERQPAVSDEGDLKRS